MQENAAVIGDAETQRAVLPSVSVVIATRDRPELLRAALEAIIGQDYAGDIECLVVHDRCEPDPSLELDQPGRCIRVLPNSRTPGLPGARNSGAHASRGALIAFCDDDDEWLPEKIGLQVEHLLETGAEVATTGIVIDYDGKQVSRVAAHHELTPQHFARRRVMEAHPSTYLVRREAFFGGIGLVDEEIPGGYGEDYDWILRAAQSGRVVTVPQPLVRVMWHRKSFFSQRWQMIADATDYLLAKHPVFSESPQGLAEHHGRKAFALAALGQRQLACRAALHSLRLNWRERRAYLALLVSTRLLRADTVMRLANANGRGI